MTTVQDDLLTLIRPPVELDVDVRKLPLDQRFPIWLARNEELVEYISRLALAAARRGARRLSAKALFEAARASAAVDNDGPTPWKLDNSYAAPLARVLVQRYPELDGLFEFRTRRRAA